MAEAIEQLQQALATYGSDEPTFRSAHIKGLLVMLGGVDGSAVAPIAERLDSPLFSAILPSTVRCRTTGRYYATAAELAGQAVAVARAAGALTALA